MNNRILNYLLSTYLAIIIHVLLVNHTKIFEPSILLEDSIYDLENHDIILFI